MRHSLHSHIIYLEHRIQSLSDLLTRAHLTPGELQEIEQQISLSELALAHYRQAYALEINVTSAGPPGNPGTDCAGGTGAPDNAGSEGRKKGRSAIAARGKDRARAGLSGCAAYGARARLRLCG